MLYFKMIVACFLREVQVIIGRFSRKNINMVFFFQVFRINTLILKLNINYKIYF
jgi:hypothetical protein